MTRALVLASIVAMAACAHHRPLTTKWVYAPSSVRLGDHPPDCDGNAVVGLLPLVP